MNTPTQIQPDERADAAAEAAPVDDLAVIIPAYNEEQGVADAVRQVCDGLATSGLRYSVIVVDDGSTDGTAAAAEQTGVQVLRLGHNGGYGAALKAGIKATRSTFVAITDADGTYPGERLPELYQEAQGVEMVVGARAPNSAGIQSSRRPAKRFLTWLASYLSGTEIPDLNSGLRVIRRSSLMRFLPILPSGFSFTTSITLAALCSDLLVAYHPIDYLERTGQSKIRPTHALEFAILILRTIVYFNPLKVFLPLGAVFFFGGGAKFVYDLYIGNLSETAVLGFLGGTLLWAVGLLSDQIARTGLGGGRRA